ncbi:recombinase family protein [Brevibacillus porteri]|uniref:recombinase family protein n=1 Tax=Brevibacillus porteri TaxID=2126350 RepID=UPI00363BAF5D
MKRVWCLYRVSTDRQVEEEDIPLQRNACKKFIDSKEGWVLEKELSELGVSGYKISVNDRDEIQRVKRGAENGEYDILLVFMADRLGRNKYEIPFMLEYLTQHGVEVWSVKEQRLNEASHENSLITYIRFWQAEGESKKTSTRVTESIRQMNEDGRWTGGKAPFGYEVFDTGIKHPKYEKNIKEIRVNQDTMKYVKLMFFLVLEKSYGAEKIANYLNESGIETSRGEIWRNNVVRRILRNPIYKGYRRYDTAKKSKNTKLQPYNESLQIIPEEVFNQVQDILNQRRDSSPVGKYAHNSKHLLLNGIARCGYCGSRLYADSSVKTKVKKSGEQTSYTYWRYVCRDGKHLKEIHPKYYFGVKKYDSSAERAILDFVGQIDYSRWEEAVSESVHEKIELLNSTVKANEKSADLANNELEALKALIIKIAMGQSKLKEEYVNEQIDLKEKEIKNINDQLLKLKSELASMENAYEKNRELKRELMQWKEKYKNADWESKKTLIAKIIDTVEFTEEISLTIDYDIHQVISKLSHD